MHTLRAHGCRTTSGAGRAARGLVLPHRPAAGAGARDGRQRVARPVCFREKEDGGATSSNKVEVADVGKAVSSAAASLKGLLSHRGTQAQAYYALGGVAAATAALALLAPGALVSALFQAPSDAMVDTMARMAAATLIATATAKYTLKEAAVRQQLHMDTFKRLNLGLMAQCALCLMVLAQGVSVRTPLLAGFLGSVCAAGLCVSARVYTLSKGGGVPFPSPRRALEGAVATLQPQNLAAVGYSLLTVGAAAMAAVCLAATPGAPLVLYDGLMGPMTVFMKRVTGAGLVLVTLQAYSLKDAADRGGLGALTFRWMNLGVAGALASIALVTFANLQSGLMISEPKSWSMLVSCLAGAAYCAYQYHMGAAAAAAADGGGGGSGGAGVAPAV